MKKLLILSLSLILALFLTACDASLTVTKEQCERQDQIKASAFALVEENSEMIGEVCEDVLKAVIDAGLAGSETIYALPGVAEDGSLYKDITGDKQSKSGMLDPALAARLASVATLLKEDYEKITITPGSYSVRFDLTLSDSDLQNWRKQHENVFFSMIIYFSDQYNEHLGDPDLRTKGYRVMENISGGVWYWEDVPFQPFVQFEVLREGY